MNRATVLAALFLIGAGWATALAEQAPLATLGAVAEVPPTMAQAGQPVFSADGHKLGKLDHISPASDGQPAQAVIAAPGSATLVTVPLSDLRVVRAGDGYGTGVTVVAGYGVSGTAAPGVTGPFGTAHLDSTGGTERTQPLGDRIVAQGDAVEALEGAQGK